MFCRGTSGLHRARWWVTPTRGDPRESATENRPPVVGFGPVPVRVKRWCKRPPAPGVTQVARQTPPGARSRRVARYGGRPAQTFEGGPPESAGRPLEPAGNGRPRWMAAGRDSAARRRGHRTRRTGRLVRPTPTDLHRATGPIGVGTTRGHQGLGGRSVMTARADGRHATIGRTVPARRNRSGSRRITATMTIPAPLHPEPRVNAKLDYCDVSRRPWPGLR